MSPRYWTSGAITTGWKLHGTWRLRTMTASRRRGCQLSWLLAGDLEVAPGQDAQQGAQEQGVPGGAVLDLRIGLARHEDLPRVGEGAGACTVARRRRVSSFPAGLWPPWCPWPSRSLGEQPGLLVLQRGAAAGGVGVDDVVQH